jgi:hypothetical protein
VPSIAVDLLLGAILPRVENPLPESIGLGFPFALAGAAGVLAGMFYADASPAERDHAVRQTALAFFRIGVVIYLLSLVVQVSFSQ